MPKTCTCVGDCLGPDGLGKGWICALMPACPKCGEDRVMHAPVYEEGGQDLCMAYFLCKTCRHSWTNRRLSLAILGLTTQEV